MTLIRIAYSSTTIGFNHYYQVNIQKGLDCHYSWFVHRYNQSGNINRTQNKKQKQKCGVKVRSSLLSIKILWNFMYYHLCNLLSLLSCQIICQQVYWVFMVLRIAGLALIQFCSFTNEVLGCVSRLIIQHWKRFSLVG